MPSFLDAKLPARDLISLPSRTLPTLYGRVARAVWSDPARGAIFILASSMHAVGHAALALAAGACAQALAGGGVLRIGRSSLALPVGPTADAALCLAGFGLAAVIVKATGGTVAAYAQARICGDVGASLRLEVLDGWLTHHRLRHTRQEDHAASAFRPRAPSRGVAALTSHVRDVEGAMQVGVLGGLRAVVQLVPLATVLVWLAPRLALVASLVFVPFSFGLSLARKRWKRANARAARDGEAMLEAADEVVRHADLWTTFGAEARVRTHVARIGHALAMHAARLEASAAGLSGANEVLGALALVLALAAAHTGWLGAAGGVAALLPFSVTFFLAYKPLRDLTDARLALARAAAALDAIGTLAETGPRDAALVADASREPVVAPRWKLGALHVEGLTLERGEGRPIDLHVAPGELVAVVGATGSGKTSLLRALLGLERPRCGSIRYDSVLLDEAPPGPRARPFAWVPQDAPLLADTLDANVALGAPADARALLASLGAGELGEALGTARLAAGGRGVSGGERQWIALARAVATHQPVLLLDEPTSGLDADAQARVLSAIVRLKRERTILLVTHRPEPLAIADAVLRLGDAGVTTVTASAARPAGRRERAGPR